VRWLLEHFEFPYQVVYPPELDKGQLSAKFDVLIFVSGAIPRSDRQQPERYRFFRQPKREEVPAEYRNRLGRVTVAKTVPQLKKFLEEGGTIVTIGSSTCLAYHLGLPLADALVERGQDGREKPLSRESGGLRLPF